MKTAVHFGRLAAAMLAMAAVIGMMGCVRSHHEAGVVARINGDYRTAVKELTMAIAEYTEELNMVFEEKKVAKIKRYRGMAYFDLGYALISLGQFDLALKAYMTGLDDYPMDELSEDGQKTIRKRMNTCKQELGIE